jgi:hypothetical protein
VIVFLAALAAILVESLTHQVFHTREMWLVLAVLEAVLYKMITSEYGIEPAADPASEPLPSPAGLGRRPEVMTHA